MSSVIEQFADGRQADHDCMAHRIRRLYAEGDDVMVEVCNVCLRVRHESDGVRVMAWFLRNKNRIDAECVYAWPDPRNDDREVWKHPDLGVYGLPIEFI